MKDSKRQIEEGQQTCETVCVNGCRDSKREREREREIFFGDEVPSEKKELRPDHRMAKDS